ncbi:MAG: transposase [Candidatus Eremiobacteraeota bacterium]|nr:transposase [Candidatus Eremiobacteraeota bacterium]MCW5871081.1 transposase [Candidatus Eremiobacteraeota bacterium]
MKRVVHHNKGRKVFLILDNARYHHAKFVREWVDATIRRKLNSASCLAYSPDLNAAEHVWRLTKRTTTHNRHFPTLELLHAKVSRRFNRFQGNPRSLKTAVARFLPKQPKPRRAKHARP